MGKKINYWATIGISCLFIMTLILFYWRVNQVKEDTQKEMYESPKKDIVRNILTLKGRVLSGKNVAIKPQVSGVIEKIYVKAGDTVANGQIIAKIKVIASPEEIDDAQRQLELSRIKYQIDKNTYEKSKGLFEKGGISPTDMEELEANKNISELNLKASQKKLQILINNADKENALIKSSLKGTVIQVAVTEGESVSKRTSNADGSTVAIVSNMNTLIFESKISEFDINKLELGMPLKLTINSMDSIRVSARVQEISPLSTIENGLNYFRFIADFNQADYRLPYTGITATADILQEQTDSVLCIDEKYLKYKEDVPYVKIIRSGEEMEIKVETGISDGVQIEVKNGLQFKDLLILPDIRVKKD